MCVTCKGGEILSSEEAGIPDGTSIAVNNLFYNTPARMKFLKKDATEAGYITDIMTRFIFAHPEISFKLITDGKEKLFSPGDNSLKNAIYTAYGKDYANGTIPVDYETEGVHITGLIGKGTLGRPKRNYQSFFVNKRYVMSRTIVAALENAYKNQIMIGKFPMAVLNIEINPSQIDINVHPTKLEVKFSNEKAIYDVVYYGAKNALYATPNVPRIEHEGDTKTQNLFKSDEFKRDNPKEQLNLSDMVAALPKDMTKRPETQNYNPRVNHFLSTNIGDAKKEELSFIKPKKQPDNFTVPTRVQVASPKEELKPLIPQKPVESNAAVGDTKIIENVPEGKQETVFVDEYFRIVGQVFKSFIIAEKGEEMLIIDQHAAHERLNYERLKEEIESKQAMSQMLIEPVIVNVTPSEMQTYRDNAKLFEDTGFEAEEFGDDAVIIRSVPGGVDMGEVEPLMLELLAEGEKLKKELITDRQQYLLYTIACKASVKANMEMGESEMENLVRSVLRLKNINTCPHGRPIIITMSKKEMEKEFKRIV